MRILIILFFILHLYPAGALAQQLTISGTVAGAAGQIVMLYRLQGAMEHELSGYQTDSVGKFTAFIPAPAAVAIHRLRIGSQGNEKVIDLFVDNQNIAFTTHIHHLTDSMKFEQPGINAAWYDFLRVKDGFGKRLNILDQLLDVYPQDGRFMTEVTKEYALLQDSLALVTRSFAATHKGSLMAHYVLADQNPKVNPQDTRAARDSTVVADFLQTIDFTDTLLLNTDIFAKTAMLYIRLYRDQQLPKDDQEDAFIRAVDELFPLLTIEPVVYGSLFEYMISYFEQGRMERVLAYIAQNYSPDQSCAGDYSSDELRSRMEGYGLLAAGRPAPAITAADINGNPFSLEDMKGHQTLLFFWSGGCPHCTVMLPGLKQLALQINAEQQGSLKIVAVSFDYDREAYHSLISHYGLLEPELQDIWVNVCDFKSWKSPIAADYYIHATPTLILLDDALRIKGKAENLRDLERMATVK
jgi:peroxiredoxin